MKIPACWLQVKLVEIASLNMGQSPSSADVNDVGEGIAFFQGKAEFGRLNPLPRKFCTAPKKIAESGDILLSVRAPVGPTNVADQKTAIGRGLAAIRAEEITLDAGFLLHYFRCIEPWMSQQGTGTTFKAVSGAFLKDLSAVLPPLAEQKAIAEKLDTLLAQVESTKARLKRIPKILKRFRQSVLAAAVSGKLTEEWRSFYQCEVVSENKIKMERESYFNLHDKKCSDPPRFEEKEAPYDIPLTWGWFRAEEICDLITKGTTPKKEQMSELEKIPFVKVYNLTFSGNLDFSIDPTFVSEETHKTFLKRSKAYPGDVLMNIVGPPLGKVSILPNTYPEWNLNQAISIFRPVCGVTPGYLSLCLRDYLLLEETKSKAKATAGQFNLTLEICRDYAIPVPPKQEQTEIVRRVDQLFAYADTIETQVNNALERVNNLTQSILAKAFRGELTEQWRKDNPNLISGENSAEALLEKIKAERAAAKPVKRGRKTVKQG